MIFFERERAKALTNNILTFMRLSQNYKFLPLRHKGTKFNQFNFNTLCLRAFVANPEI